MSTFKEGDRVCAVFGPTFYRGTILQEEDLDGKVIIRWDGHTRRVEAGLLKPETEPEDIGLALLLKDDDDA